MNIEKIKSYNQKSLAVLVTIAIIIALVLLISAIPMAINEFRYNFRNDNQEIGILSDDKIEELQKENKRKQVISYEIPKLIDTLNSIYAIPVSHKNLDEAENTENAILGLLSADGVKESSKIDDRYSKSFYGSFNNLLIYDKKKNTVKKLFNHRVNFSDFDVEYFNNDILLVFKASSKDTFKDGVINLIDFKDLYIYSLKEQKLSKINLNNADTYQFNFAHDSKDLLIRFGIDKNKNGKFEEYREPTNIKRYNYEDSELVDIVKKDVTIELQKLLEGSKK